MKKISTLLCLLAFVTTASYAQVLFSEDFDGIPGITAGGAGTYAFPAGWLLRNVDNRTPDAQVAYVNEAWERREDFRFNTADSAAFSTSYYSPTGAADDWMWTPPITIPDGVGLTRLSWNAVTYDPTYADGYEVRIMPAPNTPTGGPGDLGNQVSASTTVYSTTAEASTWVRREVDLSSYAGQTIRIAFRNYSADKFILVIDDVLVEKIVDYDAAITGFFKTVFPKIPISQNLPHQFYGRISNLGSQQLSGAYIKASVYNSANVEVFTSQSAPINLASMATSDTLPVSVLFVPNATGKYKIRIYTVVPGVTDQQPSNDAAVDSMEVTQMVFARDTGPVIGSLGIGTRSYPGYLGTTYPIHSATELSSMSVYLTNTIPSGTMNIGATVFKVQNGVPGPILFDAPLKPLGTADIDGSKWHDFKVSPPLDLLPGDTILVSAKEVDSTLAIGVTSGIFLPKTNYVNWPTNSNGGWTAIEQFGPAFARQFMIRANFECATDPVATTLPVGNSVVTSYQPQADTRNYYAENCSSLLATVTGDGTPASIAGNTTVKVWVDTDQPEHFVRRHYEITPEQNAETATAIVTLYFSQQDFDAFNAISAVNLPGGPRDMSDIANLKIEKRSGTSGNGTGLPDTYSGASVTIDPDDSDIKWNPDAHRWEVTFQVTGFSGFFLKTQNEPLPLRLVSFNGRREKGSNQLSWQTAQEENVSHFEIERSTDAKKFAVIHTTPARNGVTQHYGFSDNYNYGGKMYYRLKMVDKDKTFAYSRIVALEGQAGNPVTIFPNPVKTVLKLDVADAAVTGTEAMVIDMTGRTRKRFQITGQTQEIGVQQLNTGTYWIRLSDGRTLKFVKE